MGIIDQLPDVKAIIAWGLDSIPEEFARDSRVYTFKNFLQLGKSVKDSEVIRLIDKQKPGQCCILIYTSGTTGNPKGVMLSHDNILFSALILSDDLFTNTPDDNMVMEEMRVVSYLPLSHIAGF
jgi:long-chain-fatty-acid--CoA ligase ACSBG